MKDGKRGYVLPYVGFRHGNMVIHTWYNKYQLSVVMLMLLLFSRYY